MLRFNHVIPNVFMKVIVGQLSISMIKKAVHYLLNGVNQMVLFKHLETIEQVLFVIVQVKASKLNMINFY